jgi:hypothetical protein
MPSLETKNPMGLSSAIVVKGDTIAVIPASGAIAFDLICFVPFLFRVVPWAGAEVAVQPASGLLSGGDCRAYRFANSIRPFKFSCAHDTDATTATARA